MIGSRYDDLLRGDAGENRLTGGAGNDYLDGSDGRDTAVYYDASRGVTVDLATGIADGHGHDRLVQIESVVGSRFDDLLRGDGGDNWLTGREGNDVLDGGGGLDVASFAYAKQGSRSTSASSVTATRRVKARTPCMRSGVRSAPPMTT